MYKNSSEYSKNLRTQRSKKLEINNDPHFFGKTYSKIVNNDIKKQISNYMSRPFSKDSKESNKIKNSNYISIFYISFFISEIILSELSYT